MATDASRLTLPAGSLVAGIARARKRFAHAMTVRASWNGVVLATSDDTVVVEGNHYFPRDSVDWSLFSENPRHTTCSWKGEASYYDVTVNGRTNTAAAWYYAEPFEAAGEISDHVAFWNGVTVTDT